MRKIIHVDMDAFYAAVEQRDRPDLRGRPVIVAWRGARSVVCAASYEARKFGIRSAMATAHAERLCPQAEFIAPDFVRYRAVSDQIRSIFLRFTQVVEPLSLDEAYLDVSQGQSALTTATRIAKAIRAAIKAETGLTASAGVAPNKFLAKIASEWRKPDGLFVIQPHQALDFLAPLPVGRLPGVGKATEAQLHLLGIATIRDLRRIELREINARFGRFGERLFQLARGEDLHQVEPNRPLQQISVEETFERDLPLAALAPAVQESAARVWITMLKSARRGKTVNLKLKTTEFKTLTRSITPRVPPTSADDVADLALGLLARVELAPSTLFRLVGVGISHLTAHDSEPRQPTLF